MGKWKQNVNPNISFDELRAGDIILVEDAGDAGRPYSNTSLKAEIISVNENTADISFLKDTHTWAMTRLENFKLIERK